jgi:hypothetical protein
MCNNYLLLTLLEENLRVLLRFNDLSVKHIYKEKNLVANDLSKASAHGA